MENTIQKQLLFAISDLQGMVPKSSVHHYTKIKLK